MWTGTNNNGTLGTVAPDSWARGRRVVPHWRFLHGVGAAARGSPATRRRTGRCACDGERTFTPRRAGTRLLLHHYYLPHRVNAHHYPRYFNCP